MAPPFGVPCTVQRTLYLTPNTTGTHALFVLRLCAKGASSTDQQLSAPALVTRPGPSKRGPHRVKLSSSRSRAEKDFFLPFSLLLYSRSGSMPTFTRSKSIDPRGFREISRFAPFLTSRWGWLSHSLVKVGVYCSSCCLCSSAEMYDLFSPVQTAENGHFPAS